MRFSFARRVTARHNTPSNLATSLVLKQQCLFKTSTTTFVSRTKHRTMALFIDLAVHQKDIAFGLSAFFFLSTFSQLNCNCLVYFAASSRHRKFAEFRTSSQSLCVCSCIACFLCLGLGYMQDGHVFTCFFACSHTIGQVYHICAS